MRILEIDLIDGTPSATTSISDLLGETSFSVTTENIFDIICIKCFNHFEHFELIETFPGYVEYDISDVASGQHIPQLLLFYQCLLNIFLRFLEAMFFSMQKNSY